MALSVVPALSGCTPMYVALAKGVETCYLTRHFETHGCLALLQQGVSRVEKVRVAQIITALRPPWTNPDADGLLAGLADLESIDPVRDHRRVWALASRLTDGVKAVA